MKLAVLIFLFPLILNFILAVKAVTTPSVGSMPDLWKRTRLTVLIDPKFHPRAQAVIWEALADLEFNTCVKIVNDSDQYILFKKMPDDAWYCQVNNWRHKNVRTVEANTECAMSKTAIAHELFHTFELGHEQYVEDLYGDIPLDEYRVLNISKRMLGGGPIIGASSTGFFKTNFDSKAANKLMEYYHIPPEYAIQDYLFINYLICNNTVPHTFPSWVLRNRDDFSDFYKTQPNFTTEFNENGPVYTPEFWKHADCPLHNDCNCPTCPQNNTVTPQLIYNCTSETCPKCIDRKFITAQPYAIASCPEGTREFCPQIGGPPAIFTGQPCADNRLITNPGGGDDIRICSQCERTIKDINDSNTTTIPIGFSIMYKDMFGEILSGRACFLRETVCNSHYSNNNPSCPDKSPTFPISQISIG